MRRLILLGLLLLSGCWIGQDLYHPGDARPVLAPGDYKWTTPEGDSGLAHVAPGENGMTSVDIDGEVSLVGFVPLEARAGTFVSWSEEKSTQMYELAVRQPNATMIFYTPACDGEQAALARAAGATIQPGTVPTCAFKNRQSLEQAIRRIKPAAKQEMIRLIPVKR